MHTFEVVSCSSCATGPFPTAECFAAASSSWGTGQVCLSRNRVLGIELHLESPSDVLLFFLVVDDGCSFFGDLLHAHLRELDASNDSAGGGALSTSCILITNLSFRLSEAVCLANKNKKSISHCSITLV